MVEAAARRRLAAAEHVRPGLRLLPAGVLEPPPQRPGGPRAPPPRPRGYAPRPGPPPRSPAPGEPAVNPPASASPDSRPWLPRGNTSAPGVTVPYRKSGRIQPSPGILGRAGRSLFVAGLQTAGVLGAPAATLAQFEERV